MAIISVGTLGTGANSTSNSSYTFNTATNALSAGNTGILISVSDNTSTTDGNNNEHTSVSGGTGTWTKLGEYTNAGGSAAAGVTVSVWRFVASGTVPIGTTITLNFASNCTDKCCAFWKFSSGGTIILDTEPGTNPVTSEVNASNGFGSSAFSGLSSKARLYLRGLGKEVNTTSGLTTSPNFTQLPPQRSRNNAAAVIVRGEFRINTSTGETSNPTLAVSGDTAGLFFSLVEVTSQGLTPSRFDNSQTVYSATVSGGPVDLAPTRLDNSQTFYDHTVSLDGTAQDLTPERFDNAQTFYAHTVGRGVVDISPGLHQNTSVFYNATIGLYIEPSRLDGSTTFYSVTVSAGLVGLTPARLDNSQSFYTATASPGTVDILPVLFSNSQAWYVPTVATGTINVLPASLDNNQTWFTQNVSTLTELLVTRVNNNSSFYSFIVNNGSGSYPPPHQVVLGVNYGPTGTEYTGTLVVFDQSIKYNISQGTFVKPITNRVVISL